jgi:ATP-dependent Lon protease
MIKKKQSDWERFLIADEPGNEHEFIPLFSDDEDGKEEIEIPDKLPILPLRNTVLFPGVILPIAIGREKSVKLINDANNGDKLIGTFAQKNPSQENPKFSDLYKVGTLGRILRILEMPDGTTSVIIQGTSRIQLKKKITDKPYFTAQVAKIEDVSPVDSQSEEFKALISSLKDLSLKIIELSENIPNEASFAIKNISNINFLINYISSNSDVEVKDKQKLLELNKLEERGKKLLEYLTNQIQVLELKSDIQSKVKKDIDQQQREYILQQQMKQIQDELGGSPVQQEIEDLKKQAKDKKWNKEVEERFESSIKKLQRTNPASPEYSVQINYLQTMLELPWNEYTEDNFDLKHAQDVLDEDHFGLEKVKERILEHLAVLKLKKDMKSPIICLVGPPGVGKTSLGKSIARSLDRKYIRMSLGGLHDESEIRGHRKTYIGAMPGRIIQNIKKAKSSNPVFVLDEIDKIGQSFHGDPASALLEVLDPEQNSEFYDNFLEIEYDLSKVLFIATANTLNTISAPLRDRMEIINVSGYIVEEKIEIARRHLLKKQLEAHGLKKNQVSLTKNVIDHIIEKYTREAGVRELDKHIAKVVRSIAKKIAFDEIPKKSLDQNDIKESLGAPKYIKEKYEGNEYPGVVTGLAWTAAGGDILFIETSLNNGKGKLSLTGNLGDVMKESASIALSFIKANCDMLKIDPDQFGNKDVHIHVPEGAIPKDGPSAGITMVTSIASAFSNRKVKKNLAMTGEITLRGKVLPVGGIKEKILAAKRAYIKEIILSEENKKDVEEIKPIYLKGLRFHYVHDIMEVLNIALLKEKPVKKQVEVI